ncbi:hypothetical protein HZU75_04240 [Chitinibacter fontanus]|uniref:HTH cro/C1-type domain-containing protein n=1 Tax=Chitinibacter fontanus TaxID=1737446 RepID=A0A7D5V9A9_9NEIS|nr:helix-turn-helix domain-containing protein [Chitinibacter fontanus]QLI80800.1 hypothetical protein HZU75_04240 [Chitinibacter fontanus]
MTPAELKTLRESLGIPVAWLAEQANVQRRTVEYWEAGRSIVPADVAELLIKLDQQFDRAAEQAFQVAQEKTSQYGQPQAVELRRYRTDAALWQARQDMQGLPVTAHAVLLNRSRKLLEKQGYAVRIDYADN